MIINVFYFLNDLRTCSYFIRTRYIELEAFQFQLTINYENSEKHSLLKIDCTYKRHFKI